MIMGMRHGHNSENNSWNEILLCIYLNEINDNEIMIHDINLTIISLGLQVIIIAIKYGSENNGYGLWRPFYYVISYPSWKIQLVLFIKVVSNVADFEGFIRFIARHR